VIVHRVWWRRITNNDLYNIEKPLPPGPKGQLHIDIPNVPELLGFFGHTENDDPASWPSFEIAAKCLQDPNISGVLTFRPRPKNSRYDIPQQNINAEGSQRHPAWTSAFGWPPVHGLLHSTEEAEAVLAQTELRVLVVQDSTGDYFADFVLGETLPSHLPVELAGIFDHKPAGSLEFSHGNETSRPPKPSEPQAPPVVGKLDGTQGHDSQPGESATPANRGIRHPSEVISPAPIGSKKQGYGLTAPERKAIETWAVEVAMDYFARTGFSDVRDVGDQASYDLTMLKGGQIHFVEVKGTTGSGGVIILTRNEVDVHQQYYPYNALAIVSGIKLARGESPAASGGKVRVIQPWKVASDELEPLTFEYKLPPIRLGD
jgi:hypothetical protein